MSPRARASAMSTVVVALRRVTAPPSSWGTPTIVSPSSAA